MLFIYRVILCTEYIDENTQYPDILGFLVVQPLENIGHLLTCSSLKVSGQTNHLANADLQAKPVP
jgi:hypothetical protein